MIFSQKTFSQHLFFYVTIIGKEHFEQLELPDDYFGVNAQKHENPALEKPLLLATKLQANINFRT